jgi:hypothetical protein
MWHTRPTDQKLELPKAKIELARIQYRLCNGIFLSEDNIKDFWDLFKGLHFDGDKFYQTESDVYRHFINWLKIQNIKILEQKVPGNFRPNIEEQYQKYLMNSHSIYTWPAESFYVQLVNDGFIENDEVASEGDKRKYILMLFKRASELGRKYIYGQ